MAELNDKQKKFAERYFEHGHGTNAAIEAGYSKPSAHSQSSVLLKNPKVQAYMDQLEEERKRYLWRRFSNEALTAFGVMSDIMNNEEANEDTRLRAAKEFLDRAGFKAVEKSEVNSNQNITVNFNIPRPKKRK